MANIFDRTESGELDEKARALAPQRDTRGGNEPPPPSALDRARGRGYAPPTEDPIERAKRETSEPAPPPAVPSQPAPPDAAVDTRSWGERHSLGAKPGGQRMGGSKTGIPEYPPDPHQQFEGSPVIPQPHKVPDNYDPTGQREAAGVLAGPGNRPIPDMPNTGPKWSDRPNWMRRDPKIVPHQDEGDFGYDAQKVTPQAPDDAIKPHQDEGDFLPGPAKSYPPDKKATQYGPGTEGPPAKRPGGGGAGGGGGGGGGAAGPGGKNLGLGDQRRTAAYDPIKDRADPRNVAMVDDRGRVNPKTWETAQKGAIDPTKPGVKTGEAAAKYTNHYTNALAGATEYMADVFHQKKGDKNAGEGYMALTFKGVGAPDPKVVDGVFKVVDPNNELEPKERMELATRAMHDWYTSKGDKKSADQVAGEMLQHGNKQAQGFGKQALAAMKSGNKEAAVQAIKQAYDWLPDGFHADVQQGKLTITNDQGKQVNSFPLDDKMIANLGTGLATGTLYWDVIQQRAGKPGTFAPPQAQPTQAIEAKAPSAPSSAAAPGSAPAAPPPSPGAIATRPPGPPPPAPAAAPARPPAPPAAPPAAPGTPPSSPPTPPPPDVTQQGNRPAAPAPAAPGPAQTSEAAPIDQATGKPVEQGDGGPAGSPAGNGGNGDTQKPALDAKPPPITSSTGKRPIEYDASGKEIPQGAAPAPKPAEAKPANGEKKADDTKPVVKEPEGNYTYPKDDRDSVPVHKKTGEPATYRRRSVDLSPDVKQAQKNIGEIQKWYQGELKEYVSDMKTPGLNLKDKEVSAAFGARKKFIDEKHKALMKEEQDIIKAHNAEQKAADAKELEELKPKRATGTDKQNDISEINTELKSLVDQKEKWNLYKTNPLRLYNDEKKWAPVRNIILEVQAHNRHMATDEVTKRVVTAISHLESGPNDDAQTLNGKVGKDGARYRVVGYDLNNNIVIQVGGGRSATALHMPPETFAEIVRLRNESYGAKNETFKAATTEHNKKVENQEIRREAFKPGDPHGTRQRSLDRWFGPGEKPPEKP